MVWPKRKKETKNPQINKYLNDICRDPHPALKKTSGIFEHRRQSTFVIKFVVQWESIIVVVSVSTMAVVVERPRSNCGSRQAGDAHGSCIPITQPTLPSKSSHSFNKYYSSAHCVSGTILGTRDMAVNKTHTGPSLAKLQFSEEINTGLRHVAW